MKTYILTESRNFKTILKENYVIALDSCYIFTKEMLHMTRWQKTGFLVGARRLN